VSDKELLEFIGKPFVTRDVTFRGRTKTFNFLELSASDAEVFFAQFSQKSPSGKTQNPPKNAISRIVARIVCNDECEPMFTFEEACALPAKLSIMLKEIALKVNGLDDDNEADAKNE